METVPKIWYGQINSTAMIILNENSPKETYDELYKLAVGDVFKIEADYETVMLRIQSAKPYPFEVFPITPGTSLYTLYGCGHMVVTLNEGITD